MRHSKILELNALDIVKGVVMAVISAVLTGAMQMLTKTPPDIDYNQIGIVAITSAIAFILKQLSTNNRDEFLKRDR
jgi:hypothetical protein